MRSRYSLVACVLLSAIPGLAQQANSAQSAPAKPYMIELEQKREQTLADGTHIVRISREKQYRDGQGRKRTDFFLNSDSGDSPRTNIIVNDPTGKVAFSWMIGDHMESMYTANPVSSFDSTDVPHQSLPSTSQSRPKFQRTVESLGTREVQGFPCLANRVIIVYPIGSVSNDRPITTSYEHCFSAEFGIDLSLNSSDPRSGTMTVTAVSITREEPDASLFQPPAGFVERKVVTVPSTAH